MRRRNATKPPPTFSPAWRGCVSPFSLLVSVGAAVSITAALLIARAISGPTVRLTRTMAALAGGSVEVEIPDRQRRDEIGAMANAVEVFKENMVKGRRLASEIEHLAHHDALTDLPNRVLFHEKLEQALRYARRGRLLALHFLDLDQFKAVNDTLGHPIGDRLLQAVAERLLMACGRLTRLPGLAATNSPSCRPRSSRHSTQSGSPSA